MSTIYNVSISTRGKLRIDVRGVQKDVNYSVATALRNEVRENFRTLGGRRFWQDAARQTARGPVTADGASVEVYWVGVALHYRGGTVKATGRRSDVTGKATKSLLIPSRYSPLRQRRVSLSALGIPRENIHVIKSKNGKAYLVADTARAAKAKAAGTQLKGKKGKKVKGRDRLVFLGSLRKSATIRANSRVMPTPASMMAAAKEAAINRLAALNYYNT